MQQKNDLQPTRPGMIVWGIILILIGTIILAAFLPSAKVVNTRAIIIFLGGLFILAGVILLIAGIIFNAKRGSANRQVYAQNRDKIMVGTCVHCHNPVSARIVDFRTHKNYPEGFIYCPICKKPISVRAFHAMDKGDMPQQPNGNL